MAMPKSVLDLAIKIARSSPARYRATKAGQKLLELGFGTPIDGQMQFDRLSIDRLRQWLANQDIAWIEPSAGTGSRIDRAAVSVHEKTGAQNISRNWVRLKPLTGMLLVNGDAVSVPVGAHIEINADLILSIDADVVVVIENLEAFESSHALDDLWRTGLNVMAIYRGDPRSGNAMSVLSRLRMQPVRWGVCAYCDFDPAGIEIALSFRPDDIVLPVLSSLHDVVGNKADFMNQAAIANRLDNGSHALHDWIAFLRARQEGFTQERLIAKRVELQLVNLQWTASVGG